jgi:hypothetical protein
MKNILFAVLTMLLFATTGCDKDDDSINTTVTAENVKNIASAGTWSVTYYYDTDHEETANFSGYKFTFQANGTVSASNDILTRSGTWLAINDSGKTKFILDFSTPLDFEEISEDWEVIALSATEIQLKHVSGGGGGTDLLTFRKN